MVPLETAMLAICARTLLRVHRRRVCRTDGLAELQRCAAPEDGWHADEQAPECQHYGWQACKTCPHRSCAAVSGAMLVRRTMRKCGPYWMPVRDTAL